MLRGAAASGEDGLRELWEASEQQRHAGATMWITMLAGKREAPDGFDLGSAIDQMWLYMPPTRTAPALFMI
ncbi:MAG: hypothetical protein JWR58_5042 [Pseudonocardia sp.]|nr:hypothetical protein [Pseudonocardia sp.]